ncbi:hypothetical protein GOP47_0006852 [Adiantum capillus-veneris]|uniref:Retrotransposon gag domain-containing protein n=1 Tax=Adiantum capillus-veneris TaxID=13818 RepID=A0A9D4ZMW5_ADICA|nr:hypothetical protein GOP47_0006852 [Adiantum capillus-veneris]
MWSGFPTFTGAEDAEVWLQYYGLFLLESGLSREEGVVQAFPLLVRGKAKVWYESLQVEEKLDWGTLEAAFRSRYVANPQWSEVKHMMDNLKQSLDGDLRAFVWEFEAIWSKLVKVNAVENADFLNLTKFMDCLHVKVRDKVEVDGPCTYEEAVAYAQSKTKNLLKKQQAKQVLASPLVPRPIAREEIQVIQPFVDAHVVAADRRDDRVETIPCGPMRPQQLQRGVYQVPPDVLDQEASEKQAVEKIAEVPQSVNFVEKSELCSSYSSALDTDSTWETESAFSRYETYDVMYVDNLVKERQVAGEEPVCKDQRVGQPSLVPCDGQTMLTEEECLDEDGWGFDEPVVEGDDESQVLVAQAMARIHDMRGCVPAPVPLEEPTYEVLPVFGLDDQMPQVVFFKDNDVVESSLAVGGETCDEKAFQDVQACVGHGDGSCLQFFEGLCCQELYTWMTYRVTNAKQGWCVFVLQTDDDDQSHIFYPGGVYAMLGRAYGFPFDPGGCYGR